MKDRLQIVFKPFILILLSLVFGYTFLHWFIFIELELFALKEMVTNFVLPILLSGIAVWFIIRKRLKIFSTEKVREIYGFVAWIALSVPSVIAQEYIITATGKLTELNSIEEINDQEATKYYTLKSYYINKLKIGVHHTVDFSGKNNESLNMHIYITMPIYSSISDNLIKEPFAWLGVEYKETIRNSLSSEEKENRFNKFVSESQMDFNKKEVTQFVYLDRIGNTDDKEAYLESIKKNPLYKSNQIILVGVNEPFENRNGTKLEWILGSSLIGSIAWLIMILIPAVNKKEIKRIKAGKPDKIAERERQEFFEFILPRKHFLVTPILIYLNIGIFLFMVLSGYGFRTINGKDLFDLGANFRPAIMEGQWWRLISNIFLHGGIMHLLANMYGLLFVGIFLESKIGSAKFLMVYFVTGIIASLGSIWWYEATVSVGASGAIFGLYGVFLALLLTKVYPIEFAKSFLLSTSIFIGFSLIMGLAGGIDNAAHLSGLFSGFIIGLILYPFVKNNSNPV